MQLQAAPFRLPATKMPLSCHTRPSLPPIPPRRLYATLYVHLLQQQEEADKLLQLLQAMKKR